MDMRAFEQPAPHSRVDGFMGPALVDRLLELAVSREADFMATGVGNRGTGAVNPAIRSSRVLRDLGELRATLEARFTAILTDLTRDLRLL